MISKLPVEKMNDRIDKEVLSNKELLDTLGYEIVSSLLRIEHSLVRAESMFELGFPKWSRIEIRNQRRALSRLLKVTEPEKLDPFHDLDVNGRKMSYGDDPLDTEVKAIWDREGLERYGVPKK